jgi:hypothetical protein
MHLLELPDELLLEIISHVRFDRTFGHAHGKDSKHQVGNQLCLNTLRSLCSTNTKFQGIVEPVLYSVLIVDPHRPPRRLARYLRTVIARPVLRRYLKCVYAAALNGFPNDEMFNPRKILYEDDWLTNEWSSIKWLPFRALATREAERVWGHSDQLRTKGWISDLMLFPEHPLLALVLGLARDTLEDITVTSFEYDGEQCVNTVLGLHILNHDFARDCILSFPHLRRLDLAIGLADFGWFGFDYHAQRFPNLFLLQFWGPVMILHLSDAGHSPVTALSHVADRCGSIR